MITNVTKENFDKEVLQAEGTVLVDFWAAWCGPCRMIAPAVKKISEERSDVKVCKVNIDDEQELAIKYGVMSIPTLMVVKNGEIVNTAVGLRPKEEIEGLL